MRLPGAGKLIAAMLFTSVVCSLIYGVIVGSFSGGDQWWAAPVKIAGGLLVSTLICLPSLYIFACLSGSKARLVEIAGMVSGLLMLMTILLIGFPRGDISASDDEVEFVAKVAALEFKRKFKLAEMMFEGKLEL